MIDFISVPVTAGFTSAAAITIASGQVKSIFGLKIKHHINDSHTEGIAGTWIEVIENFDSVRVNDTILGLSCIVILLCMRVSISLRPEGAENIPLGFQVSDLCFLNQNCIRNPKMRSKQSISDPPY